MSIKLEEQEVKKVIYYNSQSNWGIFAVPNKKLIPELEECADIIITGNFEGIYEGCKVNIEANLATHPRYGKQLQLVQYKILEDTSSKESIVNFLTKSSISGIHKKLANKIYDMFGEESIHVVLHDTVKLRRVDGIGEKTYQIIQKSVSQYFAMEELLNFCASIGLSKYALIIQLFKEFGQGAVKMLKENPYQLLLMSESLSFTQIDDIAMKAGIKADDDNRLTYGLLYVLQRESILQGSTGCSDAQLKQIFLKTLGLKNQQLYRFAVGMLEDNKQIYRDDDNVYFKAFYEAEKNVAGILNTINNEFADGKYDEKVVQEELHNFPFTLNIEQIDAIRSCLKHQFNVITSKAGCGKSTISKAILRIINRSGENTVLIAPTAKAAKRLEECTGYGASTIHRFLKIKDASLESETKVTVPRSTTILIDEASMIDVRLFEKVLEAIQTDTRVILVGDTHQLPSVQAGNVLEDIINSKKFNVCYLTNITRQSDNSNIIKYSNQVNEGIFLPTELQEHDFVCNTIQSFQREQMLTTLALSYRKNVERYGLLNVQVICAYKQGVLGVNNLNKVLKSVVNENEAKEDDIFPFQVGDKVRHTINDYKLGVFNGETGVVREFVPAEAPENDEGEDLMLVDFGDKYVYYNKANSYELTLSYANTVHSSQGSEYDIVYVVLDNEISNILLVRKIVYTAITRAKKKCYIINVMPCVNTAISNDHYKVRLTKLTDFILEGVKTDIADEEFDVDEFDEIPF
jgi:exodeoxyribonuclease V alpha subunit